MPDLTKEQRDSFEVEITNATTIDAVNGIVKKAENQNSENEKVRLAKKALDDAKADAKDKINAANMPDLTKEQRDSFEAEITNATTIDVVNGIVKKAQNQNSENEIARLAKEDLDKAKAKAREKITKEKLPYLNDEKRKAFENEIDNATKAEDLNKIVERATEANKDAKDELDRENAAKNALEKLETNDNVTKEDIDEVQNLINNLKDGSTKTDLQNKLNLIKAAHELSLKKTEAKETINGLANIDGLKAGYLEEIDIAISTEAIDKILEKATAKSKEITDFNKAKEDTKNKINSLDNLKTEEKDKFLKDLDNIVDTAKIESVKSICLEAEKTNAKNIINDEALKDLTEKEKASALEKIEKATNEDEINKIVEAAKNQDKINKAAAKSLEEAKIKGKEIVNQDNMKFLTTDEIATFIARIESATTPDKVKEVVSEATALNHSRDLEKILNDKRKEAIKEIDELKNLEFSQIQMLKTKIANAMSLDEIDQVMEEARNLDRTNKLREDLENNSLWNYLPRIDRYERRVNPTPLAKASDKKDTGEKVETKTPVEIKMDSKLVIGSKTLVVTVDGVQKEVKMDVEPFISNNRTMLPIRFVAEALGFKVEWDDPTRTVILTDKDTVVKIPVDTNKIIVNGVEYESDTDPILKSNRTMLPIANIARALGLVDGKDIIWDSKTQSVTIKVNK